MKLEDGKGNVINPKDLTDAESEIVEKLGELIDTCKKYNCTTFSRVIVNEKDFIGAHFLSKIKNKKKEQLNLYFLFCLINKFVHEMTDGKLQIVRFKNPPENIDEENF